MEREARVGQKLLGAHDEMIYNEFALHIVPMCGVSEIDMTRS